MAFLNRSTTTTQVNPVQKATVWPEGHRPVDPNFQNQEWYNNGIGSSKLTDPKLLESRDLSSNYPTTYIHSIRMQSAYKDWSIAEIRLQDYLNLRSYGEDLIAQMDKPNQGTENIEFKPVLDESSATTISSSISSTTRETYHNINMMLETKGNSIPELRLFDYNKSLIFRGDGNIVGGGSGFNKTGGFGASTISGFGSTTGGSSFNTSSSGFGSNTSGFGSSNVGGFGTTSNAGGFGNNNTTVGFGTSNAATGSFGNTSTSGSFRTNNTGGFGTNNATTGGFGNTSTNGGFGANTGGFGTSNATTGGFRNTGTSSGFGSNIESGFKLTTGFSTASSSGFGNTNSAGSFGSNTTATGFGTGGGFGSSASTGFGNNTGTGFGLNNASTGFGNTTSAFGQNQTGLGTLQATSSLTENNQQAKPFTAFGAGFGAGSNTATGSLGFGSGLTTGNSNTGTGGGFGFNTKPATGNLFNSTAPSAANTGLFGNQANSTFNFGNTSSLFDQNNQQNQVFGQNQRLSTISSSNPNNPLELKLNPKTFNPWDHFNFTDQLIPPSLEQPANFTTPPNNQANTNPLNFQKPTQPTTTLDLNRNQAIKSEVPIDTDWVLLPAPAPTATRDALILDRFTRSQDRPERSIFVPTPYWLQRFDTVNNSDGVMECQPLNQSFLLAPNLTYNIPIDLAAKLAEEQYKKDIGIQAFK